MQSMYNHAMNRSGRLQLIRELLELAPAPSQESLVEQLAERGVRVTQATLSRDLRELDVVKAADGYRLPDAASPQPATGGLRGTGSLERTLRGHLIGVKKGVGIVACVTAPGHAQVVALELDRTPPAGVIGTVGGDDTIFVAVDSQERVQTLADELLELAGLSRPEHASQSGANP